MREKPDRDTYYLVIARDTDLAGIVRCVRCGKKADDVHEILPRSFFGSRNREELFAIENRCCICRDCHNAVHNDVGRGELLLILQNKYGYKYKGSAKCILDSYMVSQ